MRAATPRPAGPRESIVLAQPSDRVNTAVRVFHASIERVFRVFTEPAYAPSIWAPNPADVTVEEMDVRPGGRYAIRVRASDGSTTRFWGEYREILPPRRVVNTFHVSALPGVFVLETDQFESLGERTRLTVHWEFESREARDRMYGPELEANLTTSWAMVDQILETMP